MPRTLAQNAQYINETIKPAIKSAIESQGVTVPSTDSFLDYADRIAEIEGGGSGYQLKDLPTGSISTVNDAAELPLNALKVSVEAWQEGSGDPSPSNIRPIHGWSSASLYDTGVNLWDEETEVGNIDTTTGENSYASNCLRSSNYIAVKGGVAIMIVSPTNGRYFSYNADKVYIGNVQFSPSGGYVTVTPSSDTAYIRFILSTNYGTTYNNDVSINYPSSDTSYHAYNPNSITRQVDFGQDVYGGSANLLTGEGEDGYGYVVYDGSQVWVQTGNIFYTNIHALYKTNDYTSIIECNRLKIFANDSALGSSTEAYGMAGYNDINGSYPNRNWIYMKNTDCADVTELRAWLASNPLQVKFKLATPSTFTFTPIPTTNTLEGVNNLYADCGEVIEGEYFSGSAKGYVDGIKYAGEGDGGIASYMNVKSADELLGATAITFEVYARIDSYVNKTSGAYARLMEFGNSQQSGRLGFVGLASDNDNNVCYWDDTADVASGIETWTLGDIHLISVVKTTSGSLKIYIDGVLKYTGSSTLTITTSIIDYVTERGGYSSQVDSARQLNGEVYAWRVYAKELSAANIAQNLAADRSLYSR